MMKSKIRSKGVEKLFTKNKNAKITRQHFLEKMKLMDSEIDGIQKRLNDKTENEISKLSLSLLTLHLNWTRGAFQKGDHSYGKEELCFRNEAVWFLTDTIHGIPECLSRNDKLISICAKYIIATKIINELKSEYFPSSNLFTFTILDVNTLI